MNGRASNNYIFSFHYTATGLEIVKNRFWTYDQTPFLGLKYDEYVHVEGCDGFEIEGGAHSAADCIALDHTISLHLVNRFEDFAYIHDTLSIARLLLRGKHLVELIDQLGQLLAKELVRLAQAAALGEGSVAEVVRIEA